MMSSSGDAKSSYSYIGLTIGIMHFFVHYSITYWHMRTALHVSPSATVSFNIGLNSMAVGKAKTKEMAITLPLIIHAFLALKSAETRKGNFTEMYLSAARATVNQIFTS